MFTKFFIMGALVISAIGNIFGGEQTLEGKVVAIEDYKNNQVLCTMKTDNPNEPLYVILPKEEEVYVNSYITVEGEYVEANSKNATIFEGEKVIKANRAVNVEEPKKEVIVEEEVKEEVSFEYKNALKKAESYLKCSSFSESDLRKQLEHHEFNSEHIEKAIQETYK